MKYLFSPLKNIRKFILSFPGYKDVSDDNTNLLSMAIPGFLHPGNLYCFDYAIKNIPSSAPIIEIGSFSGLSTNILNYYLKLYDKKNKIICSDPWEIPLKTGDHRRKNKIFISKKQLRDFIKSNFIKSIKGFSKDNLPYLVESYSNIFFKIWKQGRVTHDVLGRSIKLGGKISFCYIDGDHSYKQAKKDFENADNYLEKGGYLLFDDSAPYSIYGLSRLMDEILENGKYKLVIRNPNFFFQKL